MAPLVAQAVDLSVVGVLLGTRHMALHGGPDGVLKSARRLLIFSSMVTLALNVAEPLITGEYGKAAFDAVGPLLLIGWSHIRSGSAPRPAGSRTSPAHRTHDGRSRPAPAARPGHRARSSFTSRTSRVSGSCTSA